MFAVECRYGLYYLPFPPRPEMGFGLLFAYGYPTVSQRDEP